jgi:hypothetical protein
LHHQLDTERAPECRPNTTPKFRTFDPSVGNEVHSTLNPERWELLLQNYPDSEFPNIIAGIARFGARVGYTGPNVRIRSRNHPSAIRIPSDITQNIAREVMAGRVKEIHSLPHFYYISPLGAVEKRLNSNHMGWRRIHDLSFPHGRSVNDWI